MRLTLKLDSEVTIPVVKLVSDVVAGQLLLAASCCWTRSCKSAGVAVADGGGMVGAQTGAAGTHAAAAVQGGVERCPRAGP